MTWYSSGMFAPELRGSARLPADVATLSANGMFFSKTCWIFASSSGNSKSDTPVAPKADAVSSSGVHASVP